VIGEDVAWIQAGMTCALSRDKGDIVWTAKLGDSIQSAPVLTTDAIYLASLSGEVYALR
jgi:outer membrane protein assembly factor BamB